MFKIAVYPLVKQRNCRIGLNHLRNLAIGRRYFDPKNGMAFLKIFGMKQNKPLLLSFLNSILRRKGDDIIEEVELLPHWLPPRYEGSKQSMLDVSCWDKKGHKYIVEIQNNRFIILFIQRLKYYASRTYSSRDKLFKGVDYLQLKPVTLLAIANHNIFPEEIRCISYHCNHERETYKGFLPNLSYVFVELPKFSKSIEQLKTPEDYWIHLLKEAFDEDEPPKEAPREIQEAYGILERYRWSLEETISYDKTMMAILDDIDAMRTAKNEGREEGREEGIKEGRKEGIKEAIKEGREEGKEEVQEEVACKLLKRGHSLQDISDITGLSVSKVKEL
ncbi:14113_t:CDS:1, partial [Gigaspora rosea]